MNNFNFPTCSQIWGDHSACYGYGSNQLSIIKKSGRRGKLTDFAILNGAMYDSECQPFGYYWADSVMGYWPICACNSKGTHNQYVNHNNCQVGTRPIIDYSYISDHCLNVKFNSCGIMEVLYGNYPQDYWSDVVMEYCFQNDILKKSGKNYTVIKNGKKEKLIEYIFHQDFFVRCIGDETCVGKILSDGTKVEIGKPYWIKVKPIVWLIDPEKEIALSKNILFSGLDFENAKKFMNNVFAREIISPSNYYNFLNQAKNADSNDDVNDSFKKFVKIKYK